MIIAISYGSMTADWFLSAVMAFLDDKSWTGVAVDLNHT
jgi:hypothetical protein